MSSNWYAGLTDAELDSEIAGLEKRASSIAEKGLKLDMARGKPSREQLDLSRPLLDALGWGSDLFDGSVDCSNYGCFEGIPSMRALFAELLGTRPECIFVGGESSLTLMFDTLEHAMVNGVQGGEPFLLQMREAPLKWLCPVPGYDRHFGITEHFGFEMVPVALTGEGPDMDTVEELVADPAVKGIWCVPQYSNPTGETYSDEVVRRLAGLEPAATDFRIYWDNAYCEHHLYAEGRKRVMSIFSACEEAGKRDLAYGFCSTSKITFPGAGVSAMAASEADLSDVSKSNTRRLISHDKLNQLRHMRFFGDVAGLRSHMEQHAELLRPRFELVEKVLTKELGGLGIATWSQPRGGYFVAFEGLENTAKATVQLAKELGVTLTSAGATWPCGKDPRDTSIRIAPTLPPIAELEEALDVFTTCVKLVAAGREKQARANG